MFDDCNRFIKGNGRGQQDSRCRAAPALAHGLLFTPQAPY